VCNKSWCFLLPLLGGVFVVGNAVLYHSRNCCVAEPPAAVVVEKPMPPHAPLEKAPTKGGVADKERPPAVDGRDEPEVIPPPKPQGKQGKNGQHGGNVTTTVYGANNPKPPAPPVFEIKAEGFGEKEEDAILAAENDACFRVAKYLSQTYGETEYTPTREELKSRGIIGQPFFEVVDLANAKQKAIVDVKLNAEQVAHFREKARELRVGGRMWTAGGVLAGLMALLLVGGGYLRLEEATKGYYTALLRAGALVILGTVAAALIFLFRIWY
jgi:hypothetical protein